MRMNIFDYLNDIKKERFKEAFEKNSRLPSFKVKFKLTRKCNLRCQKCNYWKTTGSEELDSNGIERIIDQITELSCKNIKFSGGEVLLRDDLDQIIKYTKLKEIRVSITTNGTLIDEKKARKIVESGIDQVTISIDSPKSYKHDRLVGVKGAWKKSTLAFLLLRKEANNFNRKVDLVLQCVVCKENYKELPEIINLAYVLGVKKVSFLPYNSSHLINKNSEPSKKEVRHFNEVIFPQIEELSKKHKLKIINSAYYSFKDITKREYYQRNPCYTPWMDYYIDATGMVYACCNSKEANFRVGSLKKTSLRNILYSKNYDKFREKCKPPIKNEICKDCINELRINQIIEKWFRNGSEN